MSLLESKHPTLLDFTSRLDPDDKVGAVVEMLSETNEVLDDMPFFESNELTGHTSIIRTGLPAPTWRKLYGGVQPTKSTTTKVKDSCGMLEAYAEVDKKLAELNGNTARFRMSEDRAHLEGMNQEMADTLFYASEVIAPEEFTGFAPRFNDLSAANADNILDAGGTGSDNTSIWLTVWGPETCFGIYPKGSKAGFNIQDLGEVTIDNIDGNNGRAQAYRTHYEWDMGLVVKDWRYVVRIANIDVTALKKDASSGADLIDLMTQALEIPPSLRMGRPAFYVNKTIRSYLRRQIRNANNVNITMEQVAGKKVVAFDEVPVRRIDALTNSEARVV